MGCVLANNVVIPLSDGNSTTGVPPDPLVKTNSGLTTSRNTDSEIRTTEIVPTPPSSSPRSPRAKHNEFLLLVKNNSITTSNAFFYVNKNPQCLFVKDKAGKTVLDYAKANGNKQLISMFEKKRQQCSILIPAE